MVTVPDIISKLREPESDKLSVIIHTLISLVSSTGGNGVSSTKVSWLSNALLLCYCSALATVGGVAVYVVYQVANVTYWAAVSALWTISTGFALSAKKHQNLTRKGILNADNAPKNERAKDEGGAP